MHIFIERTKISVIPLTKKSYFSYTCETNKILKSGQLKGKQETEVGKNGGRFL